VLRLGAAAVAQSRGSPPAKSRRKVVGNGLRNQKRATKRNERAPIVTDAYRIDIGPHIFPTTKYELVREVLIETGVASPGDFVEPSPATWEDLALVHSATTFGKAPLRQAVHREVARLEMAWSEGMVEASG